MRSCVVVLALVAGACSSRFSYVPRENSAERVSGQLAARYDLHAPPGTVRVVSLGAVAMPDGAPALRVRLVIANAGDEPWTLDTRQQVVDLYNTSRPGATPVAPLETSSPIVDVPARSERAIDLDYPLPPSLRKASHLPAFIVRWKLRAADRELAAATTFDRWPRLVTRWNQTWFGATQGSISGWDTWYDPMNPPRPYVLPPPPRRTHL